MMLYLPPNMRVEDIRWGDMSPARRKEMQDAIAASSTSPKDKFFNIPGMKDSFEEIKKAKVADITSYYDKARTTALRDLREGLSARGIVGSPIAQEVENAMMSEYNKEEALKKAVLTSDLENQYQRMSTDASLQYGQLQLPFAQRGWQVQDQKTQKQMQEELDKAIAKGIAPILEQFKRNSEADKKARALLEKPTTVDGKGDANRVGTALGNGNADKKANGKPIAPQLLTAMDKVLGPILGGAVQAVKDAVGVVTGTGKPIDELVRKGGPLLTDKQQETITTPTVTGNVPNPDRNVTDPETPYTQGGSSMLGGSMLGGNQASTSSPSISINNTMQQWISANIPCITGNPAGDSAGETIAVPKSLQKLIK